LPPDLQVLQDIGLRLSGCIIPLIGVFGAANIFFEFPRSNSPGTWGAREGIGLGLAVSVVIRPR